MKNTIVVPVRMPVELRDRIDILAHKNMSNRNHWIVKTLTREAKPKNTTTS